MGPTTSQPDASQSSGGDGSAASSGGDQSSEVPELAMTVVIQQGPREDYETESVKSFPNPTVEQVPGRRFAANAAPLWPGLICYGLSGQTRHRREAFTNRGCE